MPRHPVLPACILSLGLVAAALTAGPLNPPAGPVASSYKTLSEVEPRTPINSTTTPGDADSVYRISLPGSYYLTGNLSGQSGKSGIEIAATGVTIDLSGFDLVGGAGSLDAIASATGSGNITIANGSICTWEGDGIDLATVASYNNRIAAVRVRGCLGRGIVTGPDTRITDCTVTGNHDGIYANIGCAVSGCTAYANSGLGIFANSGGTISACSAYDNGANGISGAQACTITDCSSTSNAASGITGLTGSVISRCCARSNDLDGILVSSGCLVTANTCVGNGVAAAGGANIHATSGDNRIEANNCSLADRGIDIDLAGNFLSRNTCSGNTTNWDVVAGNICLVINATACPVILGNSGGANPGSTDPNANFTY